MSALMDNPHTVTGRLQEIEHDLAERQNILVHDCGYETPCWIWQRSTTAGGYGDGWFEGSHMLVHRWTFRRLTGALPPSPLELDHLCRQRRCCNPTHLEPVERRTNVRRGAKAKLTLEQVDEILASEESYRTLAARFAVTHQTIAYYKGGAYQRRRRA